MKMKNENGQTFIEYVTVVMLVLGALFAMRTMMNRGVQAMVKITADQIGVQEDADQQRRAEEDGYMTGSTSTAEILHETTRSENGAGAITYTHNDSDTTTTHTETYMGTSHKDVLTW